MQNMDKERRKKIQTTKLVITEIFMLVTIVVTVVVLTFIVMGYHLTEDGKLEQSGLVGVDSIPTGATVFVDGESLENKTNTSKILPEGQYEISLEKEGYTSWKKSVLVHSGLLTKLSYPHLYKTERKTETIKKLGSTTSIFSISPSRNTIIFGTDTSSLQLINIDSSEPKSTTLDLKDFLGSTSDFKIINWSKSNERLIISFTKNDTTHFAVLDLERPDYSLDLTETFKLKITDLAFLNDNGDQIFILEDQHLRVASINNKQLSDVLAKNILSFKNFGAKAALIAQSDSTKEIFLYDYNGNSTISLTKSSAENVSALVSEYLGRFTLAITEDKSLSIYRGDLPTDSKNSLQDPVGKIDLSFTPTTFETRGKEQVIITSSGAEFTVFDLENYNFASYTTESSLTFWPDDYTIGVVADGVLLFRDFDGQNLVRLSAAETGFPAAITKDNKYLYFVQKTTDGSLAIAREIIK